MQRSAANASGNSALHDKFEFLTKSSGKRQKSKK